MLFRSPLDVILTVVVAAIVAAAGIPIVRWALLDAVWSGSADDCRATGGACWAFVAHKLGFIAFGLYPPAERWRAGMALAVLVALVVVPTFLLLALGVVLLFIGEAAVIIDWRQDRQFVLHSQNVVVRAMTGCDMYGASSRIHCHKTSREHRGIAFQKWMARLDSFKIGSEK